MENKSSKNHYILSLSWQWIKKQIRNLKKWNWVSLFALFIATMSYINTSDQYKKSNEQFKDNKKSSDSLFKVQLSNSRALNDSIVNQLKSLQSITNSQLKITKDQLLVSNEEYKEKLFSGRPQLILNSQDIDTNNIDDKLFTPIISFTIQNIGSRTAQNLFFQPYIVYNDLSDIRYDKTNKTYISLKPREEIPFTFKPKIDVKQNKEFFLCCKASYYDSTMHQAFNFIDYSQYISDLRIPHNLRISKFISCNESQKKILKNHLNELMRGLNKPPFEE
jgi:hypothetical protein